MVVVEAPSSLAVGMLASHLQKAIGILWQDGTKELPPSSQAREEGATTTTRGQADMVQTDKVQTHRVQTHSSHPS